MIIFKGDLSQDMLAFAIIIIIFFIIYTKLRKQTAKDTIQEIKSLMPKEEEE